MEPETDYVGAEGLRGAFNEDKIGNKGHQK
jgi:hypothetical protein